MNQQYKSEGVFKATPRPSYEKPSMFSYVFGQNALPGFVVPLFLFLALVGIVWYSYPKSGEEEIVPIIQADLSSYRHLPEDAGGMEIAHQDSTVFEPLETSSSTNGQVEQLLIIKEETVDRAELFKNRPVRKPDFKPMLNPELNLKLKSKQAGITVENLIAKEETILISELKKRLQHPEKLKKTDRAVEAMKVEDVKKKEVKKVKVTAEKVLAKLSSDKVTNTSFVGWVVQLGAFGSNDAANNAWRTESRKYASILAGETYNIQRADLGAKGVFYRLRVGSFKTKSDAVAFCNRLRAKGGSCFAKK